ncbi:MAG: hypothetical protein WC916_05745 [Candidatus Woesearchaeota archaeon]
MNRKAAIELSANFIIIIIISIVILGAGFVLVKKLIGSAADQLRDVDNQMQDRLQLMMTNNNERIAIYPTSFELARGKSQSVAIGIMNDYSEEKTFIVSVDCSYFESKDDTTPDPGCSSNLANDNKQITYSFIDTSVKILPKEKVFKNMLFKVAKTAPNGEYVITVKVTEDNKQYAVSKIYVIVK